MQKEISVTKTFDLFFNMECAHFSGRKNLVFHGAHLQAGRIFGFDDGVFVVGHVAESVFGPAQRSELRQR